MSFNSAKNMGDILGSRIKNSIKSVQNNARTNQDIAIINTRAGWQQRYGAMQMENILPNNYALFGGWSGSSLIVAP